MISCNSVNCKRVVKITAHAKTFPGLLTPSIPEVRGTLVTLTFVQKSLGLLFCGFLARDPAHIVFSFFRVHRGPYLNPEFVKVFYYLATPPNHWLKASRAAACCMDTHSFHPCVTFGMRVSLEALTRLLMSSYITHSVSIWFTSFRYIFEQIRASLGTATLLRRFKL